MSPTCPPAPPHQPDGGEVPTQMAGQIGRWEAAGGTWKVLSVTPAEATVALTSCGGAEIHEVIRSEDPHFVAWARARI